MTDSKKRHAPEERARLPVSVKTAVLTESGYRCAVPTCRAILILDIHHIYQVSEGGGDEPGNLISLCPTCHALYHRGTISRDAIYAYKSMLVAISRAFDVEAIDLLLFLEGLAEDELIVSGDGVLRFARLIAAQMASFELKANNNFQIVTYAVNLTGKGRLLIQAWRSGDRIRVEQAVAGPVPGMDGAGNLPKSGAK